MHQNGLVFESGDYRNKFKVIQALWNPKVDILALANQSGEVCLKRFYWKTGWQKKISSELMFFSRNNKQYGEVGEFSSMCWSPDGSILAVAFENGVCHLLDVNDALILYSLKIESRPVLLKWFKIDGLEKELSETRRNQLFSNEKSFNSLECENLRTKDSEQQRDHYKIVYGIQNFCHSRVGAKLLDTALIVVTQNEDYMHGFDVYISGMLLVKSVLFDYGFSGAG
ncbi:Anaphase-promoting complex subunit 4 [Aphelenchoides bicaudatus]|nr:Anaphase-promoting complex subunit 4 [Aphelenchoides bicaudatus]